MTDNHIKTDVDESIRTLTEADTDDAKRLWLECFRDDTEEFVEYYFKRRTAPEKTLGVFIADGEKPRLVSMLCFEEMRMNTGRGQKKVAFVAGVCTSPFYRNRGAIRRLFSALEAGLGGEVSALVLQPFDFDFYKKLGFVPFAKRMLPTVKKSDVNGIDPPKTAKKPDAETLFCLYSRFAEKTPGALSRDIGRANALVEEYSLPGGRMLALGGKKRGAYALWYDEEGGTITLDEFVYTDARSAKMLMSALFLRLGEYRVPVALTSNLLEAKPAFFNMIKPLGTNELTEFLPSGGAPFDMKKY